jgi:hypothetical protein
VDQQKADPVSRIRSSRRELEFYGHCLLFLHGGEMKGFEDCTNDVGGADPNVPLTELMLDCPEDNTTV